MLVTTFYVIYIYINNKRRKYIMVNVGGYVGGYINKANVGGYVGRFH